MSSRKRDCGQTAVMTVIFMTVLFGMAAAVLDVGHWYRDDRRLQATMDAAALAAAQALPEEPGTADALAAQYAEKNGGGLDEVLISRTRMDNDTVEVKGTRPSEGVFTKMFGIDSVTVGATAKARVGVLANARWAAPIAVDEKHPFLQAKRWNEGTTLDLDIVGPGAFRLLNINGSFGGENPHTLGEWITSGYDGYMPLDWYYSDPGAKYNTNPAFKEALDEIIASGKEILLPVYRSTRAQGAGFEYEVVGWVGFVVTGYNINGAKNNKIFGHFTQVIWEGIFSEEDSAEDFGARAVSLVE